MPSRVLVALALLLLPGGVAVAQGPASRSDLRRDLALEQRVRARMASQTPFLQLSARVKLAVARKAVMARLAAAPDASGGYTVAFEEVTRQFSFLTGRQADLLCYYVLADLASILTSNEDSRDHLAHLDEQTAVRLRLYMDQGSTFVTVLSSILKKTSEIPQQITRDIQ